MGNIFSDALQGLQDNLGKWNTKNFFFGDEGHQPGYLGGGEIPNAVKDVNANLPDIETMRGGVRQLLAGLGPKSFEGTPFTADIIHSFISSAQDSNSLMPIASAIQGLRNTSQQRSQGEAFASRLDEMSQAPFFKSANELASGGGKDLIAATTNKMWEANTNAIKAFRTNLSGRGIGGGDFQASKEMDMNRETGIEASLASAEIPLKIQQYLAPAIQLQNALQGQAGQVRAGEPIANFDINHIIDQMSNAANVTSGAAQFGQAQTENRVQNLFNALMSIGGLTTQAIPALGTLFNLGGFKAPKAPSQDNTGAILGGIGSIGNAAGSLGFGLTP